jgi:small subunit ribosomal protein S1
MDLHPQNANFTSLLGQVMDFKVTSATRRRATSWSRAGPCWRPRRTSGARRRCSTLAEGQVLKGTVRTVVEWGAFIALADAGGLEGLVHISEASHDPKAKIGDLLSPGRDSTSRSPRSTTAARSG